MTLRFGESQHTPVYSKASADQIGQVVRYVVDADASRIAAVQVGGRRRKALLADWSHVVGFGPDALVVDSEESLRQPDTELELHVAAGDLNLIGRRVLTDTGFGVGALTDVSFDESSGAIEQLHTEHATVAGPGLRTIGPYAIVVGQDAVTPREEKSSG